MYAVVRMNSFDAGKLGALGERLDQFNEIHAAQPGYLGSMVVDLQASGSLVINLWLSEKHATDALSVLAPEAARLLTPLMSAPSKFIGAGTVIATDLNFPLA